MIFAKFFAAVGFLLGKGFKDFLSLLFGKGFLIDLAKEGLEEIFLENWGLGEEFGKGEGEEVGRGGF